MGLLLGATAQLSSMLVNLLHHLYVILNRCELLLEETLLLLDRLNLEPIVEKCV